MQNERLQTARLNGKVDILIYTAILCKLVDEHPGWHTCDLWQSQLNVAEFMPKIIYKKEKEEKIYSLPKCGTYF